MQDLLRKIGIYDKIAMNKNSMYSNDNLIGLGFSWIMIKLDIVWGN